MYTIIIKGKHLLKLKCLMATIYANWQLVRLAINEKENIPYCVPVPIFDDMLYFQSKWLQKWRSLGLETIYGSCLVMITEWIREICPTRWRLYTLVLHTENSMLTKLNDTLHLRNCDPTVIVEGLMLINKLFSCFRLKNIHCANQEMQQCTPCRYTVLHVFDSLMFLMMYKAEHLYVWYETSLVYMFFLHTMPWCCYLTPVWDITILHPWTVRLRQCYPTSELLSYDNNNTTQ